MFTRFSDVIRGMAVLALSLAASVQAAPGAVRDFDRGTWQQMKQTLPRPSVVVFTTTDCAYCPDVIEALAKDLKKGKSKAHLAVVVMDGAEQPEAVKADRHYRKADALYAFDGQAMALRYAVNPDWRGMTPYVAMLPRSGEPKFFTGRPPAPDVDALLRR